MTYQNSEQHKQNARNVRELGIIALKKKAEARKEEYNKTPKLCFACKKPIEYEKKINKFCSSSCSASFNNKGKTHSEETKLKISRALNTTGKPSKTRNENPEAKAKWQKRNKFVRDKICKYCNIKFYDSSRDCVRKTCSKECATKAIFKDRKYPNGSRKIIRYFNKFDNTEVVLESSWEYFIAEFLTGLNIPWIRPEAIKWVDKSGKHRLYFPDFYLPTYDLYLDPKNPYCMKLDVDKIEILSKMITLFAGSLKDVTELIEELYES